MLDWFFDAYARFNAGRAQEDWKPFLKWVAEDYDRVTVKAEFLEFFGKKVQVDKIIGRE
jgi:hypothetical protein